MNISSNFGLLKTITSTQNELKSNYSIPSKQVSDIQKEQRGDKANSSLKVSVLSVEELATLHILFGTERPKEMEIYGKNKLQHVYKGQLIDLIG